MKYFVIFLALIAIVGFSYPAYAQLDESILEPFGNSDLVIIGKVIQVNEIVSENKTQYNIQVEEYLKDQKPFDMVTAILDEIRPLDFPTSHLDYYNKPYFEEGNQVFIYLKQEGGTFKMSPYSFTLKKPTVAGPPTVIHPTDPQGHFFSQGDEIAIAGSIKKGYLYGLGISDLDFSFHLAILNEKEEQVDSKKLTIATDGNYNFSFQNKGDLRIPGTYSWEITFENGGMGGEFVIVADLERWTPLKQFKSGIPIDEIQCRESLILVTKHDGSPACVKPETKQKLIERGWTKFVSIELEIDKFGTYQMQKNDEIFEIKYTIEGGNITKIIPDYNASVLNVMLDSPYDGLLQITIPRELIDAVVGEEEDDFFVLADGIQVQFSETSNETERELIVEFESGTKLIEIIGTNPDF